VARTGLRERVARRTDESLGIVEEAAFFGDGLFGMLHRPVGDAFGGVVVCPSVAAESLPTYRIDVMLSRALAARGIAAFRFHYRGTGHSDGDPDEATFDTMRDDALAASARIGETAGIEVPAMLGSRFGALVAASAAAARANPTVLWEPALDGKQYFRQAWRATAVFEIREGATAPPTRESLADVLAREGRADVLGYPLSRALYESALPKTLLEETEGAPRPILVAYGDAPSRERADVDRAVEGLRAQGHTVDPEPFPDPFVWWFVGPERRRNQQAQVAELVERTARWTQRTLVEGASA
jgi:hypothetical protein